MEVKIITNEGLSKKVKYEDWQLQAWANCLREAEELKADPARMAAIAPILEKTTKAIRSLDDIRKAAKAAVEREDQDQDGYVDEGKPMEADSSEASSSGERPAVLQL